MNLTTIKGNEINIPGVQREPSAIYAFFADSGYDRDILSVQLSKQTIHKRQGQADKNVVRAG